MIQANEAINLALVLTLGPIIWITARRHKRPPHARLLLPGFYLLIGAYVFTILEGFFLEDAFNVIEHVCVAAAGVLFALGMAQARPRARRKRAGS